MKRIALNRLDGEGLFILIVILSGPMYFVTPQFALVKSPLLAMIYTILVPKERDMARAFAEAAFLLLLSMFISFSPSGYTGQSAPVLLAAALFCATVIFFRLRRKAH
ncbi:MAG: hypothetical protein EOP10_32155 [Proteobacteria bacterium]|nr:MAG: hypothetical protein EOP10_32155 [Pseudomonadota bacterium]